MMENEKGAALTTPHENTDTLTLAARPRTVNLRIVSKDDPLASERRNLVRQIRRQLKKDGQTIRCIGGSYYTVDLHRSNKIDDLGLFAEKFGICRCGFCRRTSVNVAQVTTDGLLACPDHIDELIRERQL
jgi:hypothetical protein